MRYPIEKNSIQETLVIPLYGRALCSRKFPHLFADQTAAELLERIDYDFSALERKSDSLMQIFGALEVAMRQGDLAFEVRDYLSTHPKAAVVNLGCGLDQTGRACDNGQCYIYNIDLPDVMVVREALLPAEEREKNLAADLNDFSWFDAIDTPAEDGAVFFAAGVFYYFRTEQVRALCAAMAERFPDGRLVFDAAGPAAVKLMLKTWVKQAGIRDVGAYFSVRDAEKELTSWSNRISISSRGYMLGYYAFFGAQLLFLLPAVLLLIPTAESYLDFLPVILLFFLVGRGLKEPMENLMQMVILSGRIVEGVSRIDNILRQQEADQDGAGDPTMFDVEFSDVEFAYTEGIPAADHVSFHLPQGTVTGLVGPSGGGKSTLAQLLLRFYEPQRGTIRIGGVDIREIPPARLMELVAYVFQDSVLFTDTIENNIRMGNTKATMEEVEQAARNAGIHEVIQALPQGYQTVVGRDDAYLSGGEKQRLAIARVFLKDAPIIILDEATAYADAENEAKIQAAFAKLAQNKTVLMIAHRLKTVERADQILVMDKGKLVGAGTHEELLTGCETYKHLVDANLRRDRWSIGKGAVQV